MRTRFFDAEILKNAIFDLSFFGWNFKQISKILAVKYTETWGKLICSFQYSLIGYIFSFHHFLWMFIFTSIQWSQFDHLLLKFVLLVWPIPQYTQHQNDHQVDCHHDDWWVYVLVLDRKGQEFGPYWHWYCEECLNLMMMILYKEDDCVDWDQPDHFQGCVHGREFLKIGYKFISLNTIFVNYR